GIYIHIPFCKQACYYCDFHFSTSLKKKGELVAALATELRLRKTELQNQTIETIYFGGGTPSLLSNQELQFLIAEVYKNYTVSANPEITLEANPDDLIVKESVTERSRLVAERSRLVAERSRSQELKQAGISRLSMGIKSLFENDLKSMSRR